MVKEGHGGEDGASDGNDVELGDVVVLQNAFSHLQPIRSSDLDKNNNRKYLHVERQQNCPYFCKHQLTACLCRSL